MVKHCFKSNMLTCIHIWKLKGEIIVSFWFVYEVLLCLGSTYLIWHHNQPKCAFHFMCTCRNQSKAMADRHSTTQQSPHSPVDYESSANHSFSVFYWPDYSCDIFELYTKICFYPQSQELKSKLCATFYNLMVLFESTYWTFNCLFLQISPHSIWD